MTKPEQATEQPNPVESPQPAAESGGELPEEALDKVTGGAARRTTGPGTQTEDDIYVG